MTVRRIYKRADFVQVKEKSRKNIGIFRGFLTMDCAKYAFYKRVRIPTVTLGKETKEMTLWEEVNLLKRG